MRNKKSKIRKIFHWLPMGLSIFVTVWSLWLLIDSLYGNEINHILLLPPATGLIGAFLIFKLAERSSNSNTKSVNIISVELARIDVENYRTSEWVLDDNTQPIQYGAHGEYMIWFLLYRTYWFAVDIGKGDGHDFYAFDVRKIANDANMPIPMEGIDLYYKREWLTRFLRDLAKKEYFLDFRHNDADRTLFKSIKMKSKVIRRDLFNLYFKFNMIFLTISVPFYIYHSYLMIEKVERTKCIDKILLGLFVIHFFLILSNLFILFQKSIRNKPLA